ncbi:MAG: hypothetical protein PF569_07365 [Candidatus Woesearchaeota archaeon]|jgi:hypothetical protein|nr:hypothetical protein [Candidatus Woesearchaeota archaeon]
MKKRYLIYAFISIIISVTINFNYHGSVLGFLSITIFKGFLFFLGLTSIYHLVLSFKDKKYKKSIFFGSLLVLLFFFAFFLNNTEGELCSMAIQFPHFRTNILTQKCEFGGGAGCLIGEPWYYNSGCDISEEEKLNILKNDEKVILECKFICEQNFEYKYCSGIYRCNEFFSCDSISCVDD